MTDYLLNDTVHLMFTTRQFSDGVPTALSGGVVDIYEDATAAPIVTGETLVASLNSVVGLNVITVTATSGTGFNANGTYNAVMQAGTVGGDSVVGEVVGTFTIEKDCTNWAKVAAPTTAVDLSATATQLVDIATAVTDRVTANTDQWAGGTIPAQTITGVPEVDLTHHVGVLASITNSELDVNVGQIIGTAPSLTGGDIDVNVAAMAANTLTAAATADDHIDLIWDEVLTGATHNIASSSGRRLRQLEAGIVLDSGTLDAATSNTVDLETGIASTIDAFYDHNLIVITGNTGLGQVRIIASFIGSGSVATVSPPWVTIPDATSTYDIVIGYAHAETDSRTAHVGLAQAGATGSITLASSASAVTDFYKNDAVSIDSGTGAGQERIITAYNGSTKVATIEPDWVINPDTTSNYIVEEVLAVSDMIAVHHSQTAADNLRDDYDGTGFTRANSTIGTVTTNTDMRGTNLALLAASINLTAGVLDEVATLTNHTAQTGDSFARIGAAGASLTDLGGMSTAMQAEILVEINTALDAAITELGVTQPSATPSVRTGIMLMYMALRNKLDVQTSGTDALEIHNAAGTQITSKLLTDDGSDYSEAAMS